MEGGGGGVKGAHWRPQVCQSDDYFELPTENKDSLSLPFFWRAVRIKLLVFPPRRLVEGGAYNISISHFLNHLQQLR